MIVAGLGSRRGVTGADVVAAIEAAIDKVQMDRKRLDMLATVPLKQDEPGIREAARLLGLRLAVPERPELDEAAARATTRSCASLQKTGLPSVAETAALAAAGPRSRLLVPRLTLGPVTCAIAEGAP